MESQISSTLVFLDTVKLAWEQTRELYSGVSNPHHIYQLHYNYFFFQLTDKTLEDYYAHFKNIHDELNIYHPSLQMSKPWRDRESVCMLLSF